jgi:hypothetical protein
VYMGDGSGFTHGRMVTRCRLIRAASHRKRGPLLARPAAVTPAAQQHTCSTYTSWPAM